MDESAVYEFHTNDEYDLIIFDRYQLTMKSMNFLLIKEMF